MRFTSVREFRDKATAMLRSREPVLVLRRGRVAGVFLPQLGEQLPLDLRRQVFQMLTADIARQLKKKGAREAEILADFRQTRRARRR
ncbi:MAG: hypothetical protein IT452_19315 [Planctomycetia bacterium]|nr:hypothetical protein [Planctomycetia bacterium]